MRADIEDYSARQRYVHVLCDYDRDPKHQNPPTHVIVVIGFDYDQKIEIVTIENADGGDLYDTLPAQLYSLLLRRIIADFDPIGEASQFLNDTSDECGEIFRSRRPLVDHDDLAKEHRMMREEEP
jgi:hypothetical protein